MATPKFIFTSYTKSFKVLVENLEELSVDQIQEIEQFVSNRKGIFDFNNYTFVIKKRLEFNEFIRLLQQSKLKAISQDNPVVLAAKPRISFGQYKGMTYDDLPDSYLLWLKTNYNGPDRETINNELKRRKL